MGRVYENVGLNLGVSDLSESIDYVDSVKFNGLRPILFIAVLLIFL